MSKKSRRKAAREAAAPFGKPGRKPSARFLRWRAYLLDLVSRPKDHSSLLDLPLPHHGHDAR